MFNWMTNCQRITEIVSESMDTPPPLYRRLWIWMHLVMCGHCSEFRQQLNLLQAAECWENGNPGEIDTEGLSDEARERIKEAIRKGCQQPVSAVDQRHDSNLNQICLGATSGRRMPDHNR